MAAPGCSPQHRPLPRRCPSSRGLLVRRGPSHVAAARWARGAAPAEPRAPPAPHGTGDPRRCPPPQAVEKNNVVLPSSIGGIMDTWTLQMGFPVVTVNTLDGTISQKHFLLDPNSKVDRPSPFK